MGVKAAPGKSKAVRDEAKGGRAEGRGQKSEVGGQKWKEVKTVRRLKVKQLPENFGHIAASGGSSALADQVGGDHYKGFAIQPVEFSIRNKLNFLQGCIVKRISRYNLPGGKGLEDLEKIKHEVDLLAELEGLNGRG